MAATSEQHLHWYALYTKSKHEKKVQYYIEQKSIETFLPTRTEIREWSDRKKKVVAPLFPNYIFVRTQPSEFWEICALPGAFQFVSIGKKACRIRDRVIDSIRKAVSGNIMVVPIGFKKGEWVRITSGGFKGIEGKFVREGGREIIVIEIDFLNRAVLLELFPHQIAKFEKMEPKLTKHF